MEIMEHKWVRVISYLNLVRLYIMISFAEGDLLYGFYEILLLRVWVELSIS